MSDVFTLDGSTLDLAATDAVPISFRERFGTVPTLTIQRRGIAVPPESSDTWMGKSLTWEHDSTLYFSGVIRSRSIHHNDHVGWVITYQALGLRDLMDKFALTDKTTGLDSSPFNCHAEDLINYSAARAGRTVGEMLTDVLTSTTNAQNLNAYGLGNYTGLPSSPALPAATVSDLAALTVIPPRPTYITGEKFGEALTGFLARNAPNYRMWVQPDGTLRFLDMRSFPASTLTMGSDPIEPTELSRDVGDCWQRVLVRGAPVAILTPLKLSAGRLNEDFAWGSYTNATAKTNWDPKDFKGTTATQDEGTCTCSSTTTIVVTSSDTAKTWAANYWDQTATGAKGTVNLEYSAATGVTMMWTAKIVSNTALTAGGTSTLTIDNPAPHTSFDKYTITGQCNGASLVWRKYVLANSALWPLVVAQSTYPQPVVNAGGGATLTSTPIGLVFWSQAGNGSKPYNCFPLPFTYNSGDGTVVFAAPTYLVANSAEPDDVWVWLPINTGVNQVASPVDVGGVAQYTGTSHSIEGLADTLVVTMPDWRDPGQASQVQDYADDLLDSVKDGVVEGSVVYHGFYADALTFGMSLNIAGTADDGTADTTGWESAAMPVVEVSIEFSQVSADDYVTSIGVSNRRAHYSAEMFLRPERSFEPIGLPEGGDALFGGFTGLGIDTSNPGGMFDGTPSFDFDPTAFGGGNGLGSAANQGMFSTGRAIEIQPETPTEAAARIANQE